MDGERKRTWWPWVIIAMLILYPLSVGPAMRYVLTSNRNHPWIAKFYTPVWKASKVSFIQQPLLWYFNAWIPQPWHAIPHPDGVEFTTDGRPADG